MESILFSNYVTYIQIVTFFNKHKATLVVELNVNNGVIKCQIVHSKKFPFLRYVIVYVHQHTNYMTNNFLNPIDVKFCALVT